jgi:integrase
VIKKRGDTYHMDIVINGRRYRESLGTTNREEAKEREQDKIQQIREGGSTAGKIEVRTGTFSDAVESYMRSQRGRVRDSSAKLYRAQAKPLIAWFGAEVVKRIVPERLEAYVESRIDAGIAPATINAEVGLFKRITGRAGMKWEWKSLPVTEQVARVMTAEEKNHLIEVARSNRRWWRAYLTMRFALNTGMRSAEIKGLRWIDIDPVKGVAMVRKSKRETSVRSVPLNEKATQILEVLSGMRRGRVTGPNTSVFPFRSWRTAWLALTEAAGVKGLRFHDLRHQVVTELAEHGVGDATIMDIVGHVSQRMLKHYSHVRLAARRAAVSYLG